MTTRLRDRLTPYWPELLVSAAVLAMFADAVFTSACLFTRDMGAYELPLRAWWRAQLLAGEFPQWLPNMGLGVPVVANPVTQAFYPPNLMMLLPFPEGLDLYVVLHLIFAGVGATQLARRLGADEVGACVAGLGYALGGYLVSMTTNPFYVCSDSYIPWIVIAMWHLRTTSAASRVSAGLALLVGLQLLAGAFQGAMFALGLGVAMVGVAELGDTPAGRKQRLQRTALGTAAAVVVAALVAAAQLLPAAAFTPISTRAEAIDLDVAHAFATHPWRLLNVFVPGPFGTPFIGPYYAEHLELRDKPFPWAYSLYSGATALVLIPAALARARGVRRGQLWALFALLVLSWLLALGPHAPVYELAYRVVPLLDRFRFPEKCFSLASLLTALLSGLGASALLRRPLKFAQLWPALLCAAVPLSLALWAWLAPDALARAALDPALSAQQLREGAAVFGRQAALATVVALAALAALARSRRRIFLAVCIVDLAAAASAYHRTMDATEWHLAPEIQARVQRAQRRHEPMRLLSVRDGHIGGEPAVFEPIHRALARFNRGVDEGLTVARPFTSAVVQATDELVSTLQGVHYDRIVHTLAVSSVVVDAARHAQGMFADYEVAKDWGDFLLLDVPNPTPRARVVYRGAAVDRRDQAVALMANLNYPADRVALFVGALPAGVPRLQPPELPPEPRPCRFERYAREHVRVHCELDRPGVAIVADQYVDGWQMTVDGQPAEIHQVNVALRGAVLPAGSHTLEFRYSTPGLPAGLGLSALGLLLLGALARRRPRPR